jgi:hypothetical protein
MAEQESFGSNFLKYTVVVTPYATSISLLYLWGYWSLFKINIFAYITLSDILKLAILPLLYIFFVSAVTSFMMFVMDLYKESQLKKHGITPAPLSLKFLLITNIILIAIALTIFIFVKDQSRWLWLGIICSIMLTRFFESLEAFKRVIPDQKLRYGISFLLVTPLCCAFGLGRRDANEILGDSPRRIVDTKILREHGTDTFNQKQLLDQKQLKYVGMANDYVFFLSLDNSKVYIVKFSDLHFLQFSQW